jgi:hypothetical protein
MVNTAAELLRIARGANNPNERTVCSSSSGMCCIHAKMNSSGVRRTIVRQRSFLYLAQEHVISRLQMPVVRRCAMGGRLAHALQIARSAPLNPGVAILHSTSDSPVDATSLGSSPTCSQGRVPSASEYRRKQGPARWVGRRCTARAFAADIRAGVPSSKSPISHIIRVLFQDYGLAPLRRAALLARTLVRSSVQVAVVPPLLPYAANFRD